MMKVYCCLLVSLCLTGCMIIPVPVEQAALEGKRFADAELDFVRPGITTRQEIIDTLGKPTLWLADQRMLVYGLRQVATGALWFMGAGLSGTGGLVIGEAKYAVFLVLDDRDVVTQWGRAQIKRGETWLSAATAWAASKSIAIPQARDRFVEETPGTQQSLIYFYRPRDYQHFLPLVPPARELPSGVADYVDIRQDDMLVGQLRRQSYLVLRVPPGDHSFEVNADTDYVVNPDNYRSAIIRLNVAPDSVSFVDVGIQAGRGTIEPSVIHRPRSDAITTIKKLRESW